MTEMTLVSAGILFIVNKLGVKVTLFDPKGRTQNGLIKYPVLYKTVRFVAVSEWRMVIAV